MVLDQEMKNKCKVCSPGFYMKTQGDCTELNVAPTEPTKEGGMIGSIRIMLLVALALLWN